MRVAYYSPLPPERSGIADYSALLLPALEQRLDVTIVGPKTRRRPRGVDLRLYHVGNNSDAHGWIVEELRRQPGVVVLHDFVLHHLVAGMTLGRGDRSGYLDAMQAEAGVVGRSLAHAVIDGLLPPVWEIRPQDFPLARSVLGLADGLVVHSAYVEQLARRAGYRGPIWRIPHPAWRPPVELSPVVLPRSGRPLFVAVGNITPSKRVPQLLDAYGRVRERYSEALLVLAGAIAKRFELDPLLEGAGIEWGQDVVRLDYMSEHELWSLLEMADICVNLRWPTMGETSGVAVRALSLGKPLVVSDVGWFSELPDSVVAKVPVDEWEVETLARILSLLGERPDLSEAMGQAARDYVLAEHNLEQIADLYVAAIEEAAGGAAVRDALLREIALAANDVGPGVDDPELTTVAGRFRELDLTVADSS